MKEPKRAPFKACGFIVEEIEIKRPTVTVLRNPNSLADKEKDLMVCGICGSLNNYQKKYCGGCGAKFKKVTLEEFNKLEAAVKKQEDQDIVKNQMSITDFI